MILERYLADLVASVSLFATTHMKTLLYISVAQNLEILEKLSSLGGSTMYTNSFSNISIQV